jgi:dTDP-4-dehydrorhamnose 3,5-epimerase
VVSCFATSNGGTGSRGDAGDAEKTFTCHAFSELRRYHPRRLNIRTTTLPDVLIVEPKVFGDDRGFFMETYRADAFRAAGIDATFVQDNHSRSAKGVLRGLHYQEPNPQGKLVRCTRGALFDVAVDIRRGSASFGKWFGIELSETNKLMLWIPAGFAHGFCALEEGTDLVYKCTAVYDPTADRAILWNDPEIGIEWPIASPLLSAKDAAAPRLSEATLPR